MRRQAGFTLLELALALLVVAILLTVAVPRLPSIGRTDLEAAADRLASTMTYLADEASLRGRIYRLTIDLDDERWEVHALTPWSAAEDGLDDDGPAFREDAGDPLARSIRLPDGVVVDAVTDAGGETTAGTRAVYFLPEGVPRALSVRLLEDGGSRVTVRLDAAAGRARRGQTQSW